MPFVFHVAALLDAWGHFGKHFPAIRLSTDAYKYYRSFLVDGCM